MGNISQKSCVIEATSGNMGIALAGICQIKGYACKIIMPENMSDMRKNLIKKLGAELILTPKELGMSGSIDKANRIIKELPNTFYTNQFNNNDSVNIHILTTAPEICRQMNGKIDVIISGIGTGATISGIGSYFKNMNFTTKIIGVLPKVYPHNIQGIGAGFSPPLLNTSILDEIIEVDEKDALYEKKSIYEIENIGIGISSGAVLSALKKFITCYDCSNKNIVIIFPDGDDRY